MTGKAIDVFQLGRSEPKGGGKPRHKDSFHLSDYPRDQWIWRCETKLAQAVAVGATVEAF